MAILLSAKNSTVPQALALHGVRGLSTWRLRAICSSRAARPAALSSSYARQLVVVDATPYAVVLPSAKNSIVPQALAVMVPATGPSTAAFLCYRWHSCLPTFNAFNVGRFHTDL